jgi:arylsulfatase A-like enzyme
MPNGKPNILVLMGDDIGWWNPSIYNHGQMGYRTPKTPANERGQLSCRPSARWTAAAGGKGWSTSLPPAC